jgi:hypothetical protein
MATKSQNEGFRMLDDFICDALPDPAIRKGGPSRPGRNEGIHGVEELVVDLGAAQQVDDQEQRDGTPKNGAPEGRRPGTPAARGPTPGTSMPPSR